jgi:PAS domain S-box-containing protein
MNEQKPVEPQLSRENDSASPEEMRRNLREMRALLSELEKQNADLRRAKTEWSAVRTRFSDLYDLAPVGYCTLGEKGLILEANHTLETLLGAEWGSLVQQPLARFIFKDDLEIYSRHRHQLFEGGQPQDCELRLMKNDGATFWAQFKATAAQDAAGAPTCHIVMSDVSERKRAEEALRASIGNLNATLDATADGILAIGGDRKILFYNQRFSEMWNIPAAMMKSGDDHILLAHVLAQLTDPDAFLKQVELLYDTHESSFDRIHFKDGRIFERSSHPLRTGGALPPGRVWSFRDISEREQTVAYREMACDVLQVLNMPGALQDALPRVLTTLKTQTGFDAVGIRLQEGDDFPYFAQQGFSHEFLLTENTLVERGENGGVCRDKDGKVSLECTCGLVISGKTDPANPLFTEGGSCWTNDSFPLLDLPANQDPRLHPRNQCIHQGYASIALVPIRAQNRILGLLQFNDRRKGCFTLHLVELLEEIATDIGTTLMRKRAEEQIQTLLAESNGARLALQDLTESEARVLEKLTESEAKYRLFFENAGDAIYILEENGRILAANPAACKQLGYSHAELLALNIGQVDSPAEARRAPERIAQVIKEVHLDFETTHLRKDGTFLPVDVKSRLITWNGQPAVMSICRDVAARKRADQFLRLVLDNIPAAVFWKDRNSVFLGCNQAIAQAAGLESPDQIVGKTDYDLGWKKEESDFYVAVDRRVMDNDQAEYHIIEPQLQADGKQRWLDTCKIPLHDDQGRVIGILGTFMDITERKLAEQEKAQLEAELQQAQKMESIGRLAGGVAHDFNNILQAILGNVELALEQTKPEEPIHQDLLEVQNASRRAADLTHQLLAFARRQTIAPRPIDLNQTVESMLTMLRRLIGDEVKLVWTPSAELWPVKMDPSQTDQILANLCVNARDAMNGVGEIQIETKNVQVDELHASRHDGFVPGDYALLMVSDTGCGMGKETQGRIFEPFFTTKDMGRGTGLGLSTVYGIVRQHQGHIAVYSEPGRGTTFRIYLPRHTEAYAKSAAEAPATPITRGNETLLLVEDELAILKLTARIIEQQGYVVLMANTPDEALRLAREHRGPIHLLLTDVVMPGMNGRELSERLKALHPNLKFMFMSGYTANVIARQGILEQGVHFIQKPFSMADLAVKIREALDTSRK